MKWVTLALFIGICLAVGGLGAVATTPEIDGWYRTLQKPVWTPPDWVFGPVWTMLYVLMGTAAWVIWQQSGTAGKLAPLSWFGGQLVLNLAWSWIFFAEHQLGWSVLEIACLWFAIAVTTLLFFRRSCWAGGLLVPYWLWVSYATALNVAIWQMNPNG